MVYKNVPGVRVEEISLLPPSVAGVDTGIPAFIGYTQKALTVKGLSLLNKAVKIFSFRDYEELFGMPDPEDNGLEVTITDYMSADATPQIISTKVEATFDETKRSPHIMYYAVRLYFDNGGGPCYIISVLDTTAPSPNPYSGTIKVIDLEKGLEVLESEDEPTIIVFPEAIFLSETDQLSLYNKALKQAADLKDRFVILDVNQKTGNPTNDVKDFRNGLSPDYLNFGAAYYPYLDTTLDYNYFGKENKIIVKQKKVAADGTPTNDVDKDLADLKTNISIINNNSKYENAKLQLSAIPMKLPPSAAIAGVYARVDSERGVWKAPANVGIASIVGPSIKVTDAHQHTMNIDPSTGKSVNAIRFIAGRGTVVWGGGVPWMATAMNGATSAYAVSSILWKNP